MFAYKPVSKGPKNPDGPFVINYTGFLLSMTAINIILDAIVVCMPLSVIQTLHVLSPQSSGFWNLSTGLVVSCVHSAILHAYTNSASPAALLPQRYGFTILES